MKKCTVLIMILAMIPMFGGTSYSDNSKFYGTYNISYTGTQPSSCPESCVFKIVSDFSRINGSFATLYIPITGTSTNYSYTECDGDSATHTITIFGDTIQLEERGYSDGNIIWMFDGNFTFSRDYNSGTIVGKDVDEDPFGCQGNITGRFTRDSSSLSYPGEWTETDGDEGTFTLAFSLTDSSFTGTYYVVKHTNEGGSHS